MCLTDGLADAGHGQHGCRAAAPGLTVRDVFRDGRHTLTLCGEFDLRSRPVFDEALALQRPLPDGMLSVVAKAEKQDPPSTSPEMAPALLL